MIDSHCGAQLFAIDVKDFPKDATVLRQNVEFQNIDIRDENAVKSYVRAHKFDGIVHLAAVSRVVAAENDKKNCIETNFQGTKYLAEAAAENPDCWMIFGSSREVYGEQSVFPVKGNAELLPLNVYGFYKLEGERIVRSLVRKNCVLRFSNIYGNLYDIPGRVIPTFVSTAIKGGEIRLEGGEQIIDFTYIDDTVASIIQCMKMLQSGDIDAETVHISPGVANKITDIIDILRDMGFKFAVRKNPPRSYDVQRFVGDTVHRQQIFGDRSFIGLREGIGKLIKLVRQKS